MSTVLPAPVDLPDPPGSPEALATVLDQLTSAGFSAGLTVHLLQPTAAVPGWQGADAAAAAGSIAAAGAVAADLHDALTAAAVRLEDHAGLWSSVLTRVRSLREDQHHQFASAAARLATLLDDVPGVGLGAVTPPAAVALVREVAGADAARSAQHTALLADLADDAVSVAAVLAWLGGPFGGAGRPGDVERVTLRLAAVLPGWGDGALTALGVQAADELDGPGTAQELDDAARRWTAHAAAPVFADALLGRLGQDGVTWLLTLLGNRTVVAEREPLAGLLAAAVGAAGPGSRAAEVLAGVRIDPADPDGTPDVVAVGAGTVLSAVAAGGRAAGAVGSAAAWGRQVLAREAAQDATAVERTTATMPDPVAAALAVLADAGDPAAAAGLLADAGSWTTLLARRWPDGAAGDLAAVVDLAARAPGAPQAAGAALQALGQGLRPGTADQVLVDDVTLTAVGGAVAGLVAGQVHVVLPVLRAAAGAVAEGVDDATDTVLRGLGHLLADEARVRTVGAAVGAALAAGPGGPAAGEVAGGFVAVEEYGQRIAHVLAWSREHERAIDREIVWTMAVTGPTQLVRGLTGAVVGELAGAAQERLGFDGTVDVGPDTGATYAAWDARRWAGAALGSAGGDSPEVGTAAEAGFARATELLGRPVPPDPSLLDQLDELQGDPPEPDDGDGHRPTGRR
ncbi:hypothetical protein O2W14_03820 [Modestobacter sp. VKM Ac-2986]|uniref:hypothetical protein n=1 Tax=Modestobacter sp. VKM Ac-2986 TaxID=3004140 RepID=UPI0022AB2FF5|nr:hypothetical protein [Modestobacter sp. VKM Ac-2986]MCZ2827963.1 hypothetical protein [Modestobacter sp. VKM Ac-2986]